MVGLNGGPELPGEAVEEEGVKPLGPGKDRVAFKAEPARNRPGLQVEEAGSGSNLLAGQVEPPAQDAYRFPHGEHPQNVRFGEDEDHRAPGALGEQVQGLLEPPEYPLPAEDGHRFEQGWRNGPAGHGDPNGHEEVPGFKAELVGQGPHGGLQGRGLKVGQA